MTGSLGVQIVEPPVFFITVAQSRRLFFLMSQENNATLGDPCYADANCTIGHSCSVYLAKLAESISVRRLFLRDHAQSRFMNRSQFYLGKIVSRGNLRKNRFRRCSGFLIQTESFCACFHCVAHRCLTLGVSAISNSRRVAQTCAVLQQKFLRP